MRIDDFKNKYPLNNINNLVDENEPVLEEIKVVHPEGVIERDKFEKSGLVNKSQIYDLLTLQNSNKESGDLLGHLKKLIMDLILKNTEILELLKNVDDLIPDQNLEKQVKLINTQLLKMNISGLKTEPFPTDTAMTGEKVLFEAEISKVKSALLSSEALDVELTSEEIIIFLKGISNEGKAKLSTLKKEVIEIFKEIEKSSGKLSETSKRTYLRILDKLEQIIVIEKHRNQPEIIKAELIKMIKETIQDQTKAQEYLNRGKSELGNEPKLGSGEALLLIQGRLGIKESSERILYFIREASDGDQTKLATLVKEIRMIFKELEGEAFRIPEISKKTYDKIMNELYTHEKIDTNINLNVNIYAQAMNIFRSIQKSVNFDKRGIMQYSIYIIIFIVFFYIITTLM